MCKTGRFTHLWVERFRVMPGMTDGLAEWRSFEGAGVVMAGPMLGACLAAGLFLLVF